MSLSVQSLHVLYAKCLVDANAFAIGNAQEVKEELHQLFASDVDAASSMAKVYTLIQEDAHFKRLLLSSQGIQNGQNFWSMFKMTPQFEKAEPVKALCLKRIRDLKQEIVATLCASGKDVKKLEPKDVKEFFEGEFPKPAAQRKRPAAAGNESDDGYFKRSTTHNTQVAHVRAINNDPQKFFITGNWYSEKELERSPKHIADGMREVREQFKVHALQGHLIRQRIIADIEYVGGPVSLKVRPMNQEELSSIAPFSVTMASLVFNEVQQNRVKDRVQALNFILQQFRTNPVFQGMNFTEEVILKETRGILNQFQDAFDAIGSPKAELSEKPD